MTISESYISYFKNLFNGSNKDNLFIENLEWCAIENSLHPSFYALFDEEEIRKVIFFFENNKAPGHDRFPLQFYKRFSQILKKDIMNVFRDLHSKGIINKNVNNTHIALIAQKKKLYYGKGLYTNQSCHLYIQNSWKTITKSLKLTYPFRHGFRNQLAFVKGRQIIDAILMTNEVVDFWK